MSLFCLARRSLRRAALSVAMVVGLSAAAVEAAGPIDYIPANTDVIGLVNVSKLLKSEAFETLAKDFPEIKQKLSESLGPDTKLTAGDLGQVFFAGNVASQEFIMAIQTTRNVELSDVMTDDDAKAEAVGEHTLYVKEGEKDGFCLLGGNAIVGGSVATLRKTLANPGANKLPAELQSVIEANDPSTFEAAVAAKLDDIMKMAAANVPPGTPFTPELLNKFDVTTVIVKATDKFNVSYSLVCEDEATAGQVNALAGFFMPAMAQNPELPAGLRTILATLKMTAAAKSVTASIDVEPATIAELVKQSMPRPGAPAPIAPPGFAPPPGLPGVPAPPALPAPPAPPGAF